MGKTYKDQVARQKRTGGVFMLNQKSGFMSDKRTKRNRSRSTEKQKAIAEQM